MQKTQQKLMLTKGTHFLWCFLFSGRRVTDLSSCLWWCGISSQGTCAVRPCPQRWRVSWSVWPTSHWLTSFANLVPSVSFSRSLMNSATALVMLGWLWCCDLFCTSDLYHRQVCGGCVWRVVCPGQLVCRQGEHPWWESGQTSGQSHPTGPQRGRG